MTGWDYIEIVSSLNQSQNKGTKFAVFTNIERKYLDI